MPIRVEGSRSLARSPPLSLSFSLFQPRHRRRRDHASRIGPETIPLSGAATTYQAYRSQNDLRPLDERDRIERGPGLSAAVRSAVHLSATEAEISKLTQRPSACACVRRYDGRRRPRGCVRMRIQRRVRPEIPYSHPRPSPLDFPCRPWSRFIPHAPLPFSPHRHDLSLCADLLTFSPFVRIHLKKGRMILLGRKR